MPDRNSVPSTAEFGQLRSYLAVHGVSQQTINSVIGTAPEGRTRSQIAQELRAWLKDLPKA